MIRIYRDPDPAVNPSTGGEPVVEVKFSSENPPRTKEDWNKLAQSDPQTWISLTQNNTDRMVRENRELQEKLQREQQEKNNYAVELNRIRSTPPVVDGKVSYGTNNYPRTAEEWDGLFLENPTFAADLRYSFLNRQTSIDTNFQSAQANYRKTVQAEHPDMYASELDVNGNPRVDEHGKLVLQKGNNGEPIYNPHSEKGKLWEQIWAESARPDGTNPLSTLPNAPALMQAELERRLRSKGEAVIKNNVTRQNQVATPGVPPPVVIKGSFKSKEEESHVKKQIERGLYKDEGEYFNVRDGESQAVYGENRRPDFSRK